MPRKQPCVTSYNCLLQVLPSSRATQFYVAESTRRFYFLQHENALRSGDGKTRNSRNFERNIC